MRNGTDARADGGERVRASDVFADRGTLDPSFVPDRLPERAAHRRSLTSALTAATPQTVALLGRPGQGKTTTARQVTADADGPVAWLSGSDRPSVRTLAVTLHNDLAADGEALARTGHSEERACSAAAGVLEASDATIVLDDADRLAATAVERFVTTVVDPGTPLVLVADSVQFRNDLSRSFRTAVVDDEVVFGPYDAAALERIVERRAVVAYRPDVVAPAALERIAAIGADAGGDARLAVEILRHAGDVAVERNETTVTSAHVDRAHERVRLERHRDLVTSLSAHERATLAAVATLADRTATPATVDDIVAAYRETAEARSLSPNGTRSVRNYLATLVDAGVVARSETERDRPVYELAVDPSVLASVDA